ncbi:hypothetical protein DFAR_530015 [Desulfarculales bacterium]
MSSKWTPLAFLGPSSSNLSKNRPCLLIYRIYLPLASRGVARSHLAGVSLQDVQAYLLHHLKIAGIKQNPFSDPAVTAIQQGSGGFF